MATGSMQTRRSRGKLIIALFLALGSCYYYFDLLLPLAHRQNIAREMAGGYDSGGDFYPIWLTGRELLLRRQSPYTQNTTRDIQVGLYGRPMDPRRPGDPPIDFRAFSYPVYMDLVAAPLLPLTFTEVRIVLSVLLPVLTGISLILWLRALDLRMSRRAFAVAVVLLLSSYPVLEGLFLQQVGLFVGFALAVSVAAIARGRLALAGILLALASVKPQLMWLLALWLLVWALSDWKNRRRFAVGFVAAMISLLIGSEFILPEWLSGWWCSIAGYSHYTLPPLAQLVFGSIFGKLVEGLLLVSACAVGWATRRLPASAATFSLTISFLLLVTIAVAPTGSAVFDQVILMPAILWLGFRRSEILNGGRALRVATVAAALAVCWQWLVATGVSVLSLFALDWVQSPAVIVFPTRMAAPLPFLLLLSLSFFVVPVLRENTGANRTMGK